MRKWISASLASLFSLSASAPVMADANLGQDKGYVVNFSYAGTNKVWLPGREIAEQECPAGSAACSINDARLVRFDYQYYFASAENAAHETIQCVGFKMTPESAEKARAVKDLSFGLGVADPLLHQFLAPAADNDPSTLTFSFGNCIDFGPSKFVEIKNAPLAFYEKGRIQGSTTIPYLGMNYIFKNRADISRSEKDDSAKLDEGRAPYDLLKPRACNGGYQDRFARAKEGDVLDSPAFCP